jgi:spermidine synthase
VNRGPLTLVIALAGASTLALEILGTRILGPWYGVSLDLWSVLIATTLAALAAGYALGGRLADRGAGVRGLAAVLAVAGAWTLALPWMVAPLVNLATPLGLRSAMLALSVILFGPPLVLLGMVGPLAIRLSARSLSEVGRVSGDVFAVSTLASVLAALATGFWLIPALGVRGLTLLIGSGVILAAAIALVAGRGARPADRVLGLVLALVAGAAPLLRASPGETSALVTRGKTVALVESPYAELRVVDTGGLRYLLIDGGAHTVEVLDNGLSRHPYVIVAGVLTDTFPRPGRALIIGLGGGSLAKLYARAGWRVDAVEIDSEVTRLAHSQFELQPFHARVVTADGRRYLATTDSTYDLIVFDAYGSASIPFHLVTEEAFAVAKRRLAPGGILALNVEAIGWHDRLIESVGATLARSFAHVIALPIAEPPNQLGNLVLAASDRELSVPDSLLGDPVASLTDEYDHWRVLTRMHGWHNQFVPGGARAIVLTDDRNPADLWSAQINLVARRQLIEVLGPVPHVR